MKQYQTHLQTNKPTDIANIVLLPASPQKAERIGTKFLTNSRKIAEYREFITYTGYYQNTKITTTSTGIGCPSTAIAVEELINLGAKILIRVGTCGGSLKSNIKPGSLIIPTACIREEGTTKEYIPYQFPAVADFQIVQALNQSAEKNKFSYYNGINRTHDAFYGQAQNIKKWGAAYLDPRMKKWSIPIISSEMETSALFVIALLRGIKAGAVLAVNANPEPLEKIVQGKFNFSTPVSKINTQSARLSWDKALKTALEAAVSLNSVIS